jgi:hypothetical protein
LFESLGPTLKLVRPTAQIEGRLQRWQLFHHVHLLSRTLKRMPPCSSLVRAQPEPGAPGWHVLNGHLGWMLPPLLQITCCLHSLYSQQVMLCGGLQGLGFRV